MTTFDFAAMVKGLFAEVSTVLEGTGWAEDEIKRSIRRHPRQADTLWHSFKLLVPVDDNDRWNTEFVYRAHARELLERVAAGEDTRPGTDVEMILVCMKMSLATPINTSGTTLYLRLWHRAFPQHREIIQVRELASYEHVGGSGADTLEPELRRRLSVPDRRLNPDAIRCCGLHHGVAVPDCPYQTVDKAA
jgi:hypothetical protein